MVITSRQRRLLGTKVKSHELYSRELDMLDGLFLFKHPPLPFLVTVGHAAEDDLGHFQSGVAEAH